MRQAQLDASAAATSDRHTGLPLLIPPGQLTCALGAADGELRVSLVGGLGLIGQGASDAARAIICGILLGTAQVPAEIVIPAHDAHALLSTDREFLGQVPGLTVVDDIGQAFARLETARLSRVRAAINIDVFGINIDSRSGQSSRNVHSEVPELVLVASAEAAGPRLRSVLADGVERHIYAVVIGEWLSGTTCHIAPGGQIRTLSGQPSPALEGATMFTLSRGDVHCLLDLAREAGATVDPPPRDVCSADQAGEDFVPAAAGHVEIPESRPAENPGDEKPPLRERPVQVAVLGQPGVHARGTEMATGLRTDTRNLLSLLAVHRDGLTIEAAAEALWPDAALSSISSRFHTAVGNARTLLREATGAGAAKFIVRIGGRYRLDSNTVSCDLWRFEEALTSAAVARDQASRLSALRQAADAYTGALLDGCGLEWAEPPRESARRRAADALRQLADLTWEHDPDGALGYLERALTIDEYNEELHQHVMRRQASLGRHDAVRRTYQHLTRCLAQIEAEPDTRTTELVHRLTSNQPSEPIL